MCVDPELLGRRRNGRRWSLVATPDLAAKKGINNLSSVSCTAPRDCWAVGDYGSASSPGPSLSQILHWNGTKWSAVSAPEPAGTGRGADNFLAAVSCTSATNCWAAGDYGSNRTATSVVRNQTVHWNGHQWALVPSPDPAGTGSGDFNFLSGISCSSAASCWAVGARAPKSGTDRDQALRWNGASWSGYS